MAVTIRDLIGATQAAVWAEVTPAEQVSSARLEAVIERGSISFHHRATLEGGV
jgi:hypothetical protein